MAETGYETAFGQMDIIERFGKVHGYLNYQEILNIAVKLRGTDIFMDMVDDLILPTVCSAILPAPSCRYRKRCRKRR